MINRDTILGRFAQGPYEIKVYDYCRHLFEIEIISKDGAFLLKDSFIDENGGKKCSAIDELNREDKFFYVTRSDWNRARRYKKGLVIKVRHLDAHASEEAFMKSLNRILNVLAKVEGRVYEGI